MIENNEKTIKNSANNRNELCYHAESAGRRETEIHQFGSGTSRNQRAEYVGNGQRERVSLECLRHGSLSRKRIYHRKSHLFRFLGTKRPTEQHRHRSRHCQ